MKLSVLPIVLLGVLLNVAAQLALKFGTNRIGALNFVWSNIVPIGIQLVTNPWFLLSMLFYVISIVIWIFVLCKTSVSVAYPLVSLGYIVNAIAAHYMFGEELTLFKLAGILLILLGVAVLVRS